ncbi:MAG: CopD family protein [Gammaproteobacteria bacterium]
MAVQPQVSPSRHDLTPLSAKVRSGLPLAALLADVYAADSLAQALEVAARLQVHESVVTRDGVWMGNGWMHAKLVVVALVLGYHHACGVLLRQFVAGTSRRSHRWFRWFNEAPVLMLVAAVILVVVKPF